MRAVCDAEPDTRPHCDAVGISEPVSLGVSIGEPYSGPFVWSVCGTHWVAHSAPDPLAVAVTVAVSLCTT